MVFNLRRRGQVIAGFGGATALLLALTILTSGWHSLVEWVSSMVSYPADMLIEYDIATLAAFYAHWVPPLMRLALEGTLLAATCGLAALVWHRAGRRGGVPLIATGYLWAIWFLVTPFAHWHDEILLTLPVLALLGRDARNLVPRLRRLFERRSNSGYSRLPFFALYVAFATILVPFPLPINILFLPLLGIAACLTLAARQPLRWLGPPTEASRAAWRVS